MNDHTWTYIYTVPWFLINLNGNQSQPCAFSIYWSLHDLNPLTMSLKKLVKLTNLARLHSSRKPANRNNLLISSSSRFSSHCKAKLAKVTEQHNSTITDHTMVCRYSIFLGSTVWLLLKTMQLFSFTNHNIDFIHKFTNFQSQPRKFHFFRLICTTLPFRDIALTPGRGNKHNFRHWILFPLFMMPSINWNHKIPWSLALAIVKEKI